MSMVITAAHKELERLSRKRPAENSSVPFVHALRDVMHTAHAARKTGGDNGHVEQCFTNQLICYSIACNPPTKQSLPYSLTKPTHPTPDCPLPLWHCATPLYKVLCASMRSLGLLSVSGLECCTLLRHHVATPEYCDVGHHSVLQGVFCVGGTSAPFSSSFLIVFGLYMCLVCTYMLTMRVGLLCVPTHKYHKAATSAAT